MKRGQLQSLEPIIVTIFLALILGILLLLYLRMSSSQSGQQAQVHENAQDIAVLKRVARLPEIACSRAETGELYCIDKYKALAFSERMANPRTRASYFPLLGAARINITIVGDEHILLYNNTGSNVRPTIMYTTVYDPLERTRKFAMIMIERGT